MSGNLCRCGAYTNIADAVDRRAGAGRRRADDPLRLRPRRATSPTRSAQAAARATRFLAGGTNLVDLMKENVERPDARGRHQPAAARARSRSSTAAACASARWSPTPRPPTTRASRRAIRCSPRRSWPAPARSCATPPPTAATSTSARAATTSTTPPRRATSASPARAAAPSAASTRIHAILGASEHCIATHPSDMCVALAALEAQVRVTGPGGERVDRLRRLPPPARRRAVARQHARRPANWSPRSTCRPRTSAPHYTYLKLRDRLSYAFALVSVAVGAAARGRHDRRGARSRSAASRTSRGALPEAEAALRGPGAVAAGVSAPRPTRCSTGAVGQGGNDFKIELARRADRPRAAAGRRRHAAIADRQARRLRNHA